MFSKFLSLQFFSLKSLSLLILGLVVFVTFFVTDSLAQKTWAQQGVLQSSSSVGAVFDEPKMAYLKLMGMKKPPKGALVIQVFEGSPADEAGLKSRDFIKAVNGEKIRRCRDFLGLLNRAGSGTSFQLAIQRGKQKLTLTMVKKPNESIENLDFKAYSEIQQALSSMSIYDPKATAVDYSAQKELLLSLITKAKEENNPLFLVRLKTLSRRLK